MLHFQSLMRTIKKFAIFLILLPFLTGIIAYIFESNTTSHYTAKVKIELGNFENTRLTDPKLVPERLLSQKFLENTYRNFHPPMNVSEMRQRLNVTFGNTPVIELQLTGSNKKHVERTLKAVVEQFLNESNSLYEKKYNLLKQRIEYTRSIETVEERIERERLLYDLELTLLDLRPTVVIDEISVSESGMNPSKKAVLGFLLGLIADMCFLFFWEVFRKAE
ncbi:capsular polysaccharide biosynthesis protein [Anoxybacillus kamchatkensis]|uniref:hypothetical protein n=1 Tax=Anoxybacillus ayderensis TaxID=265546 RepID=UPI0015EB88BA|nr:hypothetical protein [Anoxybacillus ayderensis]MBA2877233.1 capsular polysaccharide biosynthesis protein [Anoxybacillus ayderensis]